MLRTILRDKKRTLEMGFNQCWINTGKDFLRRRNQPVKCWKTTVVL